MSVEEFNPNWTVHPGRTLVEALRNIGKTQAQLASECGVSQKHISQIVTGDSLYSARLAIAFSKHIGSSAGFWWNLRNNYEMDLALGRKDSDRPASPETRTTP